MTDVAKAGRGHADHRRHRGHAPKGTLSSGSPSRWASQIPRFCDHPLLAPVGACRQCLVEVEGQRKPVTSCTTPVAEGMVVRTQLTSEVAARHSRASWSSC